MEMIKTGIVVEGGAMRGIYGAGVLDVLLEKNIHADRRFGRSYSWVQFCIGAKGTLYPVQSEILQGSQIHEFSIPDQNRGYVWKGLLLS